MKTTFFYLLIIGIFISIYAAYGQPIPAFPGAEGWGANTPGGRNGTVLEVTNLNDNGPGSLREAIENPHPRIIIFKVSGTIELQSMLEITAPFLTLAGQTAPGDGICLKNFPLHIVNTHDIVVRFLRIRPGIASGLKGSELDGIEVRNASNVMIDHCTVNWTNDEAVNNWHKSSFVTIQWCIIAEPLHQSVHEKGAHGYGASIGGYKASFHHNVLSCAVARNASIAGNNQNPTVMLDVRNCVIANWQHRSCDGKPLSINLVNNYYKPGPATLDEVKHRIARIDNAENMGFTGLWYIAGNYVEGSPTLFADNWNGGVDFERGASEARNRRSTPFEFAPVTTQSAQEAYEAVLQYAGVIAPGRDAHEKRIIEQIRSNRFPFGNRGIIDSVEQVGGWPALKSTPAPTDSDKDGMPDAWENAHGLKPNNASDANQTAPNGYTNIENYINSLIECD
ncbi:MAG: pectate lyase [Dysgonamonadaceae bacterium]|nr:pectate lyase [Dysgonamonadaceae bacterium]